MKIRGICTVPDCGNPHAAKGLCRKHYYRMRENGHLDLSYRNDGDGHLDASGYVVIGVDGKHVRQHIQIAERVLGRPLPSEAIVHHHNENKSDNRNDNLVICPDQAYHMLLHKRMRAIAACGNPDWRPCVFCRNFDDPTNMRPHGKKKPGSFCHAACRSKSFLRERNSL